MKNNQEDWRLHESIPVWTAFFAGLAFVTGFVVELSFLDRFGIRETGIEFFKAKYMHVGILHLLFPCLVAVPCCAIFYLHRHTHQAAEASQYKIDPIALRLPFVLNRPMALLAMNLLTLVYVFAVLVPPGTVSEKKGILAAILLFTVISPWMALWIAKLRGTVGERRRLLRERLLLLACIPVLAADVVTVRGKTFETLIDCLSCGGYTYFVFVILELAIIHRLKVWTHRMPDKDTRMAWWTAGICILAAVHYLSAVSFAYRVFPFIAADKGGGDYTDAALVTVHLHDAAVVPMELLCQTSPTNTVSPPTGKAVSKALIIIEETEGCVYLADPKDAGGPYDWRCGSIPAISQICRADIASIIYASRPHR